MKFRVLERIIYVYTDLRLFQRRWKYITFRNTAFKNHVRTNTTYVSTYALIERYFEERVVRPLTLYSVMTLPLLQINEIELHWYRGTFTSMTR